MGVLSNARGSTWGAALIVIPISTLVITTSVVYCGIFAATSTMPVPVIAITVFMLVVTIISLA